jgi:ribosome-binding factor A
LPAANHDFRKLQPTPPVPLRISSDILKGFFAGAKMPEQRGKQHHLERMSEALKEEIGAIIEGELGDPRIGLCDVTEVLLAPDGKSARVFVHVSGDEEEGRQSVKAIEAAKGYIRHELLDRLGVRHVPELTFILDRSPEIGARIDELLGRTRARSQTKTGQKRRT